MLVDNLENMAYIGPCTGDSSSGGGGGGVEGVRALMASVARGGGCCEIGDKQDIQLPLTAMVT